MSLIPWRKKRENHEEFERGETSLAHLRREIDGMFDRFFRDPWGWGEADSAVSGLITAPPTDLADSENEVTVTMELPGVDPKEVDINITGDVLSVRGEKKAEKEEKKKNYHYVERQVGSFQRSVQLPSTVDAGKVDAKFKNGVLTITIAKNPEAKPKRITVRNA
jgi:HSP20 family protein